MASMTDVAGVARESIGRYFSLVSFIPSALLVAYAFVLLSSGSLHRSPDLADVAHTVSHLTLADLAALIFLSVAVGLALHPLQFVLVQVLEGYWGAATAAQHARSARIWWHYRRLLALRKQWGYGEHLLAGREEAADDPHPQDRIAIVSQRDEADRLAGDQPDEPDQIMPTRLGNVLRYYESAAGAPYGLNAIQLMPYLARVASPEDMEYVNDQRSNLDLAVRLSFVSVIASVLSLILLWRYGLWLLAALLPYAVALLS